MVLVGLLYGTLEGGSPTAGADDVPGALEECSRGTRGVLKGYSRGTQGVLKGYSSGTLRIPQKQMTYPGHSRSTLRGTLGVLEEY
jgi:hypothetical protein